MNGISNNIPPSGQPPPNPVGVGLPNIIVPGGPHSAMPHTYNGRRRNYRRKRALPRYRAPANRQNQPQGQGRKATRQPPRKTWRQNQQPPRRRAGRPLRTDRQRWKNRRQNTRKGSKRGQNIEIEREVTVPAQRQPNNRRQWRRNRPSHQHPAPLQRWNQTPTWQPPSTTATPVWEQPQTTAPSVWQPSLFDWFPGWLSPTTVPPPVYVQPPAPSSVEHSKTHGTCFVFGNRDRKRI